MSEQKKILITGASTGFGRGAAQSLAERGHRVYATMRGVSGKNENVAAELRNWATEGGHKLEVLELDVTDEASVKAAVDKAIGDGGLDVVINNAGVGTWGIDENYSPEQAAALFNVNLFGVMRVNRAALPHLREKGQGTVIYVSSGLGRVVFPFVGIYTASKFALEAYAETVSLEIGPLGVESVIVQPGAYGTSFLGNTLSPAQDLNSSYGPTAKMLEAFSAGFEERAKSGQLGDPKEVVDVLVEESERKPGAGRPLRRPVGADMIEPVTLLNDTSAKVQEGLLAAFGMK